MQCERNKIDQTKRQKRGNCRFIIASMKSENQVTLTSTTGVCFKYKDHSNSFGNNNASMADFLTVDFVLHITQQSFDKRSCRNNRVRLKTKLLSGPNLNIEGKF